MEHQTQDQNKLSELLQIRRNKLDELRELGIDPFGGKFERTHHAGGYSAACYRDEQRRLGEQGVEVRIAGRIMQKRGMGKASFAHIQDLRGKIQIYVRRRYRPEVQVSKPLIFSISAISSVLKALYFKTKTGETSVKVKDYEVSDEIAASAAG